MKNRKNKNESRLEKVKGFAKQHKTVLAYGAGIIVGVTEATIMFAVENHKKNEFLNRPDMLWVRGMLGCRKGSRGVWWTDKPNGLTVGDLGKIGAELIESAKDQSGVNVASGTKITGMTIFHN